ncbi:hypothetical protein, partial [Desulfosarcina cetonica]|uniref:hypothetical protein n=1 Tax=Desulfosarcina cetonica TaxID=90730 RepID=UPI0012EEB3D8
MDDAHVMNLLGGLDHAVLSDLSAAVFSRDISRVLAVIADVFKNGQDLKRFYADLLMHFRHLMLVKMAVRADILAELSPGEIEAMADQVKDVSLPLIDQTFTLLFNAETNVRHAYQPRLAIEMVFSRSYRFCRACPLISLSRAWTACCGIRSFWHCRPIRPMRCRRLKDRPL